ncbi:Putative Csn12 family protein [Septoria linicola]|uniref:Csn12 family protein n=1 Tax=Septoria linicola TaxID=215465 RepID=A0A9Q9EMH9_9PEZI|nr:Putative Csn12 family protein [Septoria linicola]
MNSGQTSARAANHGVAESAPCTSSNREAAPWLLGDSSKREARFTGQWLAEWVRSVAPELAQLSFNYELEEQDLVYLCDEAAAHFGSEFDKPLSKVSRQVQQWLTTALIQYFLEYDWAGEEVAADSEALVHGSDSAMAPSIAMTAMLGQCLTAINGYIQAENEEQLTNILTFEPPFTGDHSNMIAELRQAYPKGSEDALEKKCTQSLVAARDGTGGNGSWTPFITFIAHYLTYLRDVDLERNGYLETYNSLITLQEKAQSALVHPAYGHLMLLPVVNCAKLVCRLAIGLDKQPELIAHLKSDEPVDGDGEGGPRDTLPERAADTLRKAFTTCLNDRTSGLGKDGRPTGKKKGIYKIANICLKILFQCRKTRNATMIFMNIGNQSPPLSAYPRSEQVTYLYYLGRFLFQTNHFYRAQEALQHAYNLSPTDSSCVRQRRHILVYLTTCNLILGRFPSASLLQRHEALHFQQHFGPIMQAMRTGDLGLFRRHLDLGSPSADWLLHFRILLQLQNRCEVHVWRALIVRTWQISGHKQSGRPENEGNTLLDINKLVRAFNLAEKSSQNPQDASYVDPDLDGADLEIEEEAAASTISVESRLSSLISQGFLLGTVLHTQLILVILGMKAGNVVTAGFPSPWKVIKHKANAEVPGWRKLPQIAGGGGQVINMKGARAAGSE